MINLEDYKQFRDTSYFISSEGKIIRKYKNGKVREITGTLVRDGKYKRYRVYISEYKKKFELTRLVYETYRGEIPKGYVVSHRNSCSTMNEITNLYLVKETSNERQKKLQSSIRKVVNLNNGKVYKGLREASRQLNHSRDSISQICSGNAKKLKLNIAWYDDVNSKAFRGNYQRYHDKYMSEV